MTSGDEQICGEQWQGFFFFVKNKPCQGVSASQACKFVQCDPRHKLLCEAANVLSCFCRVIKGCPFELAMFSTFQRLYTFNSKHSSIKHQEFAVLWLSLRKDGVNPCV